MITIQKANTTDIPEIKALLKETWHEIYKEVFTPIQLEKITSQWHSPELLSEQIIDPHILFLAAKDGDKIIALCNTDRVHGGHINIQRIHVRSAYRRQGLGTKLIEKVITSFPHAKKIDLEVEETNSRAMNFYLKHGFKKVGTKVFEVVSIKIPCIVMEKAR